MRRSLHFPVLLALCFLWAALSSPSPALGNGAVEVDSGTLLQNWEMYDGREVVFRGEVVGDVMARGDYAWVTVNDDHYSRNALHEAGELRGGNSGIGVWVPVKEAEKIGRLGRFGSLGDFVEVRGIFHADCAEHGGDFDIHASTLTVLHPGRETDTSPGREKYYAAALSFLFLLLTLLPLARRRAMERRSARAFLMEEREEET